MLALLSVLLGTVMSREYFEENNLANLTDKNFDNFLQDYEKTVIFFYTPTCGPW
jgi:hypothetical protein